MSSLIDTNESFTKAISSLCFVFGAAQTILLGLIPKIAIVTNLEITSVIVIYGISIFFFLFMTKEWAALFSNYKAERICRVGQFGLLLSTIALLATFQVGDVKLALFFFILSRLIYALTASSIIPFSHVVKIGRYAQDENSIQNGIFETTIFLNTGRLVGLILGGLLAFNLSIGLLVLICILLISILLGPRGRGFEIEVTLENLDRKFDYLILPLFLIPLAFTFMSSFFHTSITSVVGEIFIGQVKQSATIYWSLTIASLVIVLTQLLLKKVKLINSKAVAYLAISALVGSFYSFSQISDLKTLYIFIILLSFSAAIIPIIYMEKIYKLNSNYSWSLIASKISFYQTLGNALGAIVSGVIIKLNLTNYILILFTALVLGVVFINFKYRVFQTRSGFDGVTHG